jgi:hypothetical protein
MDQAMYIYGGQLCSALMELDHCDSATGFVGANVTGGSTLNFTNYRLIKITIDGTAHYIPAAQTIS